MSGANAHVRNGVAHGFFFCFLFFLGGGGGGGIIRACAAAVVAGKSIELLLLFVVFFFVCWLGAFSHSFFRRRGFFYNVFGVDQSLLLRGI